jgi:hypothetical protein
MKDGKFRLFTLGTDDVQEIGVVALLVRGHAEMLETLSYGALSGSRPVFHAGCCEEVSRLQATRCWREMDSNPRSPRNRAEAFSRLPPFDSSVTRYGESGSFIRRPTGRYSRPRICRSIGASTHIGLG